MMGLVAWMVSGGWRYVAGALAIVAVIGSYVAAIGYGYHKAEAQCEAQALKTELAKVARERDAAKAQIDSAGETNRKLEASRAEAQTRARDLQLELDKQRDRPAAQDGKKPNANALVDDRCNFTRRGVQFFSR